MVSHLIQGAISGRLILFWLGDIHVELSCDGHIKSKEKTIVLLLEMDSSPNLDLDGFSDWVVILKEKMKHAIKYHTLIHGCFKATVSFH